MSMSIWDDIKLVHLASNASFNRGFAYYKSKAVLNGEKIGDGVYQGKVSGSQDNIYDVVIDIDHPRKSICTCPFAAGRRVICKHMVALYFFHFSEQAKAVLAEWEEEQLEKEKRHQEWESEYLMFRKKKLEEVIAYVNNLDRNQLREELIKALMREFDSGYPDDEGEYYDDEADYYYDEEDDYF